MTVNLAKEMYTKGSIYASTKVEVAAYKVFEQLSFIQQRGHGRLSDEFLLIKFTICNVGSQ